MIQNTLTESFNHFLASYSSNNNNIYDLAIRNMEFNNEKSLVINFFHIVDWNQEKARDLLNKPEETLPILEAALKERISIYNYDYANVIQNFHIRIKDLPQTSQIPLRKIRSSQSGKLIQISGIVTEMSSVRLLLTRGVFRCNHCLQDTTVDQNTFDLIRPYYCSGCDSRRTGFRLIPDESEFVDYQKIVIQETLEDLPSGQLPRKIECHIKDDITDATKPGERVNIVGVLKTRQVGNTTKFNKYLEVNYIENLQVDEEKVVITNDEINEIETLSKDPNLIDKMIQSLAPTLYGLNNIKKAILLSLFGGRFLRHQDPSKKRGEIHLLIMGDPGLGKSILLKNAEKITPTRAIYTTGRGSTAAGLTAAIVHEKDGKNLTVKAGALVLADKGVAYIDEFEKMRSADMQSIHEPLEQLTVTIAKAGINLALNARTTIIAAANPKYGRYDTYKSPAENIQILNPTIFSRFDLIFVLLDTPNITKDTELSNFMLNTRENVTPIIDRKILKKYIYYARKNFSPKISQEAKSVLQDFYVNVRDMSNAPVNTNPNNADNNPVTITPRYLEGLMRLTEAFAKLHLRNIAIEEDAQNAKDILSASLRQVGIDPETGLPDIDRIVTGTSTSRRSRLRKIEEVIRQFKQDNNGEVPTKHAIFAIMDNIYNDIYDLDKDLDSLYNKGIIYKPNPTDDKYDVVN